MKLIASAMNSLIFRAIHEPLHSALLYGGAISLKILFGLGGTLRYKELNKTELFGRDVFSASARQINARFGR